MHKKNIHIAGKPLDKADKVLLMIHGRGGDAIDFLGLAAYFSVSDFAIMAPEATNRTWYPNSFLAPTEQNEPWLSSALDLLAETVSDVEKAGISREEIYFAGFSQGACLLLEFVARHADRFGGVAAFTGGLIGAQINEANYSGDFARTPVFIGTGNPDPHVPLERVYQTVEILKKMNADVTLKIYDDRPHTISQDEIDEVNRLMFR